MKNSKRGSVAVITAIIVGLIVVGGGVYYVSTQQIAEVENNGLGIATSTGEKTKEVSKSVLKPEQENPSLISSNIATPAGEARYKMIQTGDQTYPQIEYSNREVMNRVNDAILKNTKNYLCVDANAENGYFSKVDSKVVNNSTYIFSVDMTYSSYCGGSYPIDGHQPMTFDLITGELIQWEKHFSDYEKNKISISEILVGEYKKTEQSKSGQCKLTAQDVVEAGGGNIGYYISAGKIVFIPSFHRLSPSCPVETVISPDALSRLKQFASPQSILVRL